MKTPEPARSFLTTGGAYDAFMGRYSVALADPFLSAAQIAPDHDVLDVGCGPGALTGALVNRIGASHVSAFDPSPPFVADCGARYPGVDVRVGRVEEMVFDDGSFDAVLAQLVWHFVVDPSKGASECMRVLRPGGTIGASVWDLDQGMEMLRMFWEAAKLVDPNAPDEARFLQFGAAGELAQLFAGAGFVDVQETMLEVDTTYVDFAELWSGFMAGIGPAGVYLLALPEATRHALHEELFRLTGSPTAAFSLSAIARCVLGTKPTAS